MDKLDVTIEVFAKEAAKNFMANLRENGLFEKAQEMAQGNSAENFTAAMFTGNFALATQVCTKLGIARMANFIGSKEYEAI